MTTISARLIPRKKFTLRDEISQSLRKFKHQQESGWVEIPIRSLMTRLNSDFLNKRIFVVGTNFDYIPQNIKELVSHIKVFGTPQIKPTSGKKLSSQPVFSGSFTTSSNGVSHTPKFDLFSEFESYISIGRAYMDTQYYLKPKSKLFQALQGYLTPHVKYLALATKFLELCLEFSLETAYKKYLQFIQEDPDFREIDVTSHYSFLLNLHVRGVADLSVLRQFEDTPTTGELAVKYLLDIQNGLAPPHLISRAAVLMRAQQDLISCEAKLIRAPKISKTRISQSQLVAFVYDHFLVPKIPKTVLYRIKSGYTVIPEDCGRFTAYAVGKSFGQGMADQMEDKMEKVGEKLCSRLEETLKSGTENAELVSDSLLERASELIRNTFANGCELIDKSTDRFIEGSKRLLEMLPSSLSGLTDSFNSLHSTLESVLNQFKSNVSEFIKPDFKFDIPSLIEALKYYVLFINVDNSLLKSILFMLILNCFGGLGMIWKYVKPCIDYLSAKTSNGEPGSFTSGEGILAQIFSSVKGFTSLLVGVMGSIFSGRILTGLEFSKLVHSISNPMRDISFISRGIDGILSIFKKMRQLITFVVEWVRKNIFKVDDEKTKISKRIVRWSILVRYFSTEAGMNAIRLSSKAKKIAGSLYSEGMELLTLLSPLGKVYDKDLYSDVTRLWRDAKTISSYVTRLEAMSHFQPTMFHIQFVGQAGIGKSTLTEVVTRKMLSALFGEDSQNSFWAMNPNVDHFDGYAGQKVMIVDDVFRYDDPKHLTSLIGLITNTPVVLPMANLEDKGTQLTSEIMISSTNKAYPSGKDIFCMEAIHRRRHMLVRVVIDPRVRSPSTGSFEEALFNKYYPGENKHDFPHLTFSLLKPVPERPDIENLHNDDQFMAERFAKTLKMMNEANEELYQPEGTDLPSEILYRSKDELPEGIQFPCVGWSFDTFLLNCLVRFRSFRKQEAKLSASEKIARCVESIDQLEDVISGWDGTESSHRVVSESLKKMMGEEIPRNLSVEELEQILDSSDMGADIPDFDESIETLADESLASIIGESEFSFIDVDPDQPSTSTGTFTSLTLDLEKERRARILSSKNRSEPKDINKVDWMAHRLKYSRHGYKIDQNMTRWDLPAWSLDVDSSIGNLLSLSQWKNSVFKSLEDTGSNTVGTFMSLTAPSDRIMLSRCFQFPNSPLIPEHLRGTKTKIPLYFLSQTSKIGEEYYFQPKDDIEVVNSNACYLGTDGPYQMPSRARVLKWRVPYEVPVDTAFVWSANQHFINFVHEFSLFGPSVQDEMIKFAKWRNQYTGLYTAEALVEFSKDSLLKYPVMAYKYISQPLYSLFDLNPGYFTFLFSVLGLVAVIWTLKSIAGMLLPKSNHTSKYLHRGPQSGLVYTGRFTSLLEGAQSNETQMIDSLFRRNVRKVVLSDSRYTVTSQGLFSSQYLLINKHSLMKLNRNEPIQVSLESPNLGEDWDYRVFWNDLYEDPESDLAILYSKQFPMARSIEHHFVTPEEFKDMENPGGLIFLSSSRDQVGISQNEFLNKVSKITLSGISIESALLVEGSTIVGKSGSTVLLPRKVKGDVKIVGLQAWEIGGFFSNRIAVQVVTTQTFSRLKQALLSQLSEIPIERQDDFQDSIILDSDTSAFTSVTYNNIVTEVPKEQSVGNVGKTQFKRTPIAKYMDTDGFTSARVPAVLSPYDKSLAFGREIHPLNHSLNKYFKDKVHLYDDSLLNYIEDSIVNQFSYTLDKKQFKRLTYEQIVTGTREDGSNPMNLKTSPGIPYIFTKVKKGKKDFFEIGEELSLIHI